MNLNKTYSVCSKFLYLLRTNSRYFQSSVVGFSRSSAISRSTYIGLRSASSVIELQEKCTSSYASLPKENLFCHKVLEDTTQYSLVNYSKLEQEILSSGESSAPIQDILSQTDFSKLTANELCELFKMVTCDVASKTLLPMSDKMFTSLCDAVENKASEFTDNHLANMLLYACFWPMSETIRAPNFVKFWKALDQECLVRWRDWSTRKMFYFIDLWFTFRLVRMSDFAFNCINFLAKKPGRLTGREIVQLMFYINTMRTVSRGMNMFELEHRAEECMSNLSLAEIGIVALGFFKTQTRIKSDQLTRYMIHRLIAELDTVSEITLTAILKCARLSLSIILWHEVPRLLDALVCHLTKYSLQCNVHIALLSATCQTLHPPTLVPIVSRLLSELSTARLKDIEKILQVISQYDWQPPGEEGVNFTQRIADEIRKAERAPEVELHAKSFVALVNYLTVLGHFPHDLIDKILQMDYLHKVYGKNKYNFTRDVLCIDNRVEIECPEYKGSRLPTDISNYLAMRYSHYLPNPEMKMSSHSQFMHDIKTGLDCILGPDKTAYVYTVPFHPRADIIYQIGGAGKLPPEIVGKKLFNGTVAAPKDGTSWHAVVPGGKNMFLTDKTPNGETQAKLRALSKLGYTPHLISIYDWTKENGKMDIRDFLSGKLDL